MDKLKTSLALTLLVASHVQADQDLSSKVRELEERVNDLDPREQARRRHQQLRILKRDGCLEYYLHLDDNAKGFCFRDQDNTREEAEQDWRAWMNQKQQVVLSPAEQERLAQAKAIAKRRADYYDEQSRKMRAQMEADRRRVAKQQAEVRQWEAEEAEKERKIVEAARKRDQENEARRVRNQERLKPAYAKKRSLESQLAQLQTHLNKLVQLYNQYGGVQEFNPEEMEKISRLQQETRKQMANTKSAIDWIQSLLPPDREEHFIDYITPPEQRLANERAKQIEQEKRIQVLVEACVHYGWDDECPN